MTVHIFLSPTKQKHSSLQLTTNCMKKQRNILAYYTSRITHDSISRRSLYGVSFQLDLVTILFCNFHCLRIPQYASRVQGSSFTPPHKLWVKFLSAECSIIAGGNVLATDVQRVKKPKLPKKRFLKKSMTRAKS